MCGVPWVILIVKVKRVPLPKMWMHGNVETH